MRECDSSIVDGDEYAIMIAGFVRDALQFVERAHDWTALQSAVEYTMTADDGLIPLASLGGDYVDFRPKYVYYLDGSRNRLLGQMSRPYWLTVKNDGQAGDPRMYYVSNSGVQTYPRAVTGDVITVDGIAYTANWEDTNPTNAVLSNLEVKVPVQPVIHYALAYASRERGDMGAQSFQEWYALAERYLSDAIAHDASMNPMDFIWREV